MSFETITVHRDFPIINDYVQVQPNREGEKTTHMVTAFLAAVANSVTTRLPPHTNRNTGRKFGGQEFIRVPGQTFALNL